MAPVWKDAVSSEAEGSDGALEPAAPPSNLLHGEKRKETEKKTHTSTAPLERSQRSGKLGRKKGKKAKMSRQKDGMEMGGMDG